MTSNHQLLFHLAELMLEIEKHILPVDDLFDDDQIGDYVKSIQIDSPYQQMLLDGVLTETVKEEKLHVSFTVEGYFHYVLGEVIFQLSNGKDADFLVQLLLANQLNGIKEGVEQCLIRDVNNQQLKRLIAMVDIGGEAQNITKYPLAHAFLKTSIGTVFQMLMESPSVNDWNIIKNVRSILLGNQKQTIVEQLDSVIKESDQLRNTISALMEEKSENLFYEALKLISFYTELNALDQAKIFFSIFIENAEKNGFENSVVEGLENLGESEYKRSGRDGYLAAMEAFTKSLAIREKEAVPQRNKLKNTYRSLGLAYLSLGLQVVKSNEYFVKAKEILVKESDQSADLAAIHLLIGIVNFWRGLRAVGRWAHADPSLLEGLSGDLFDYADSQFQLAYDYYSRNLGKSHPQTLEAIHYLQENRYSMGNYEKAIPWLKKYVEILPFKNREHTDYFYLYCLIVSLEEFAKKSAKSEASKAIALVDEAKLFAKDYDECNQITDRLNLLKSKIEKGEGLGMNIPSIEVLPTLASDSLFTSKWGKWGLAEELKGFTTNSWLTSKDGIWFYNTEKKEILHWEQSTNELTLSNPTSWPEVVARIVYDPESNSFYAWSSIRSTVYQLNSPDGSWKRLSHGIHDVHACGASFGFDPVNNRLFEFGGYGYFTYKNWFWVYDLSEYKWIQLRENKPGIAPYPRNGQMTSIANGEKVILLSGIGNDTGIQREHKARMGLASATDVGYFTWLRDAYSIDLKTMEWTTLLTPNHESIRHEGAMGYIEKLNMIVNWAGIIPSPLFGQEATNVQQLSCWNLDSSDGFKSMNFEGEHPPFTGGYFQAIPGSNELLYIHPDNIWKLTVYDR